MLVVEAVLSPQLVIGAALAVGLGLFWGWRNYQRCPHCGRIVPRVSQGWFRCRACGRQYRKGLRVR